MIRTFSPSKQDRYEPSGSCSRTGGLRVDLARASSGPGGGDLAEERGIVEPAIEQDQHVRPQQRQQTPGLGGLVSVAGRAERGTDQTSGAGLEQGRGPRRCPCPGSAYNASGASHSIMYRQTEDPGIPVVVSGPTSAFAVALCGIVANIRGRRGDT